MAEAPLPQPSTPAPTPASVGIRSLRDLLNRIAGSGLSAVAAEGDAGISEALPFPFLALIGQSEMKLALLLALINPALGGVLLLGPRGTGKTTAVRSLADLLPQSPRSLCYYGCMPEDIETGGIQAVCPDCAKKFGLGEPLAVMDRVRLVELPLNARLEDVIGSLDERAALHERLRLRRGILAQADRNLLFVDEINLLADEVTDAILDASAQGHYTVRRGPVASTFRSRFVLIGSMNPEEGRLRPQILDRFGLRVIVRGLSDKNERLEAYQRVHEYKLHPRAVTRQYADAIAFARAEIQQAREMLPLVRLPDSVAETGLHWVSQLRLDSLRAEITLFEAARAYAAADARSEVTDGDLRAVAAMSLRLRRSEFIEQYLAAQSGEDASLAAVIASASRSGYISVT